MNALEEFSVEKRATIEKNNVYEFGEAANVMRQAVSAAISNGCVKHCTTSIMSHVTKIFLRPKK